MFRKTQFSFKALAVAAVIWCCVNELPGGTLSGTFADIPAGADINLSAAGPLDWVHWGLYTETSVDRKTGVTPLISDFTALYPTNNTNAFVFVYRFGDNANGYSWSDGAPTLSVTNTTSGVWAYGIPQMGTGFEITVPADTSTRTLKVYVGAYAAKGEFEATLSDGSATAYTDMSLSNIRSGQSAVYSIEYAANSAGQKLTIKWKLVNLFDSTGNVTLQSAALTAVGANNPPIVSITNPTNNETYTAGANITIDADASDLDGSVTKVEFYDGANKLGEEVTGSPYSFTWTNVPAGYHVLTAVATDNQADFSYSQPVEIFVNTLGGSLSGSNAVPPGTVDLTSEGTADWAHWGFVASNSFDHKNGVTQKISNFSVLGTNAAQQYSNNYTVFSWSDGTPTASATDTPTGVFITGVGNGFRITAPADTTPRRLKIYAGLYGAKGDFQAYLSDFSAQAYTDTSVSNVFGDSYVVYTLDYSAASSGQSLIVQYRSLLLYDQDFGNVTLQAATLQGGSTEPLPVLITNPMKIGNDFALSFATQSSFNYQVEYSTVLPATSWTTVTNLPGTGGTVTVTNQNIGSGQRFYRVQTQ